MAIRILSYLSGAGLVKRAAHRQLWRNSSLNLHALAQIKIVLFSPYG